MNRFIFQLVLFQNNMTLYVIDGKHGSVIIGQQAHVSHWKLEIDETQVQYIIEQLQALMANRAEAKEKIAPGS